MQLRYWNLIGKNSGLMIVLYAIVIIGGFYYDRWLDGLPDRFPGALAVSLILVPLAVRSPIRTLLMPADSVFLLPVEPNMSGYFRRGRVYSFAVQSAALLSAWLICMPLYFETVGNLPADYAVVLLTALIAKGWNMDCRWRELFIEDLLPLKIIRLGLSFVFIFSAAARWPLFVSVVCLLVMLAAHAILFRRQAKDGLMDWARVLEMENQQEMQFLRFVNLFTDVPRLRRRTRSRRLISSLFPVRHFDAGHVYDQLFIKTFIRADAYFGIYIRLTLVGIVICMFVDNGYFTAFIVVSVIYLTGLQLLPLWKHPFPYALESMYPIDRPVKRRSFIRLLTGLLMMQSVLFGIFGAAGVSRLSALPVFLASGWLAVWLLVGYAGRKTKKG